MNTQSNDEQPQNAWAWYDDETLAVRHVGFNQDVDYGPGLTCIPMDYGNAIKISSGEARMFEFVVQDLLGKKILVYNKQKPPFKKFSQLIDIDSDEWSRKFDSATGSASPVRIKDRSKNGFVVDMVGQATNVVFYITMKNDPNYLIETIDLYPFAEETESVTDIPVTLDIDDDYSVYVRYDGA
jgi:hypothetical protein